MQGRTLAVVVPVLLVLSGCSSSDAPRTLPKPCRLLRTGDARRLLGPDAKNQTNLLSAGQPVCTYVAANGKENAPSVVVHVHRSDRVLDPARFADTGFRAVRIRGIDDGAFWVESSVRPSTPAGTPVGPSQVVGGMLAFTTGGDFVQIDAGGTAQDLAHARAAARIVVSRLN